jgi:hypothetical protein
MAIVHNIIITTIEIGWWLGSGVGEVDKMNEVWKWWPK